MEIWDLTDAFTPHDTVFPVSLWVKVALGDQDSACVFFPGQVKIGWWTEEKGQADVIAKG